MMMSKSTEKLLPMTASSDSLPTYQSSGRIGLRSVSVALLVGIPSALVVGVLFAWARASASGFVSIALCDLLFMVANVLAVGMIAPSTRSRSALFNTVFALAWVGLMLLPWWLYSARELFAHPLGATPTPAQVGALLVDVAGMALEAVLLGLVPVLIARGMSNEPFSEQAGKRAERDFAGELYWHDDDSANLLSLLRYQGVAALLSAPRAVDAVGHDLASTWRTLKLAGKWVESDPTARWLDIEVVAHERADDGRIKSSAATLITAWQLPHDDYLSLRQKIRPAGILPIPGQLPMPASTKENADSAPTPAELAPAIAALSAENYAATLSMARAHCMHPLPEVRADAHRLCALALARLERWPDSFAHYHELFGLEPSAFNALQLATTSVVAGELLRGQAWFERAIELNHGSEEMPMPRMRTTYISSLQQAGELAACLPHLNWLAGSYRAVKTTDSQLLWSYGLPFFGEFLAKSEEILREILPPADIGAWYAPMREDLDEAGQNLLDRHLEKAN